MTRKYFGTDGVRGRVGEHPMTVEFALRLAGAAARVLAPQGGSVLIGKDTDTCSKPRWRPGSWQPASMST